MNTSFTTNQQNDGEKPDNPQHDIAENDLFRRVIILEFALGLIGIFVIAVFSYPTLGPTLTNLFDLTGLAFGVLAGISAAAAILIFVKLTPAAIHTSTFRILALFRNVTVTQALALGLAAGIGEELLFRGALQPLLGTLITSVLFAALHPFSVLYVALAFIISLGLGWLTEVTGGLAAPIAAHACYDALILLAIRFDAFPLPEPEQNKR